MVLVEIVGLHVEAATGNPVVLLREVDGQRRVVPIFIGTPEAVAIAMGIRGEEPPRPLTHDLLAEIVDVTGMHHDDTLVSDLVGGTFHATVHLSGPAGDRSLSSRPSDALALAVRTGAPVFVSEHVLDQAGVVLTAGLADDDEEEVDADAVIEEFRGFLDDLTPEDFLAAPGEEAEVDAPGGGDDAPGGGDDAPGGEAPSGDTGPPSGDG